MDTTPDSEILLLDNIPHTAREGEICTVLHEDFKQVIDKDQNLLVRGDYQSTKWPRLVSLSWELPCQMDPRQDGSGQVQFTRQDSWHFQIAP